MLIVVDTFNKAIYPCDLKTSSHYEWDFPKSFIDWCYFIQAQLYWEIIHQNLMKDDYFKNYKLMNYRFIVVNRKTKTPLVWEFEDTRAITDLTYGDITLRNWRNIVKELDNYLKNTPKVPQGIDLYNANSIKQYFNNINNGN